MRKSNVTTAESDRDRRLVRGCPKRRWTFDEIRKLRQLAGGMSVREIAQLLRRSEKAVVAQAGSMSISLVQYGQRSHAAKYPDSAVEHARRMHAHGWSPRRIAAKHGWPVSLVKQWVYFQIRLNDPVTLQ